jgi:tetratricopeptide (TPR) repeat protein
MMRRLLITSLLAIATPSCATWDPDYEPDPDVSLRDLLAPLKENSAPLDSVAQERLRFAVERLATRHPGHVPSQIAASALAIESGESQRAQGYIDRVLSLEPTNVEARCLRIRIAVADGSLDLARKLVDDGLRLRPDSAALYESSAWLYQLRNRMDAALAALDAAETLNAPKWRICFHRGLIAELSSNYDNARQHYEDALAANNGCTEARQRLAGLTARQGVKPKR